MRVKYIPNILCLFRIFCVLPFICALIYKNSILAILTVILGGASDFFDGYIARKYKCETRIGALLDPLADKIFANVVLWSLVMLHQVSFPYLCVYLILAFALSFRDFVLLVGSSFILSKKITINLKPLYISKICTTLVFIFIAYSITFLGANFQSSPLPYSLYKLLQQLGLDFGYSFVSFVRFLVRIGLYIGYTSVLMVIVTFVTYIVRFIKNLVKNGS